jgi:hypothetical protein
MRILAVLIMAVGLRIPVTVDLTAVESFSLSCHSIRSDTTASDLAARFGVTNVTDGPVDVGEGLYEPGTIVYPDIPEQRAEFTWKQAGSNRSPDVVRIRGEKSAWKIPGGVTLGLTLTMVERLNRRPFRLLGFGWDDGGTTTSWSGGALAQAELPMCAIWAKFGEEEEGRLTPVELRLLRQVNGEREFSSGHPGMQAARAHVLEIGLSWRP